MLNAVTITATDVLMFRDGRPFNQDDPGGSIAHSLFPPPPPTVVGAIRLSIAQQNGFVGSNESWPKDLVGDGVNWQDKATKLGALSFGPLRLSHKSENGTEQPLFPMPAHVMKDNSNKLSLLKPASEPAFSSDLGDGVILASGDGQGLKTIEGGFVTQKGMVSILQGKAPASVDRVDAKNIYAHETRVGIGINKDNRIVQDAALYTAGFVRLHDGVRFLQPVDGLPDDLAEFTQRLGGEHRTAAFMPTTMQALPSAALSGDTYAAIAIAPVFLAETPRPGSTIDGLPGKVQTICMEKPIWLGGWDSTNASALPLRQVIPAGAVFFMKCDANELPNGNAPLAAGLATNWGFGHCLAAAWPV